MSAASIFSARQCPDRTLPARCSAILTGPAASGKTTLLFQLAYNLATEQLRSGGQPVLFVTNRTSIKEGPPRRVLRCAEYLPAALELIHVKYISTADDLHRYLANFHMLEASLRPCALVIDDIDRICKRRGRSDMSPGTATAALGRHAKMSETDVQVRTLALATSLTEGDFTPVRYVVAGMQREGSQSTAVFARWLRHRFHARREAAVAAEGPRSPPRSHPAAAVLAEMKGLTLHQPWASALIDGPKRVENRKWELSMPAHGRGLWVLIHAGSSEESLNNKQLRASVDALWPEAPERTLDYQRGVLLGLAHFVRSAPYDHVRNDPWALAGHHCWLADRVLALPRGGRPRARGRQGLWDLDEAQKKLTAGLLQRAGISLEGSGAADLAPDAATMAPSSREGGDCFCLEAVSHRDSSAIAQDSDGGSSVRFRLDRGTIEFAY